MDSFLIALGVVTCATLVCLFTRLSAQRKLILELREEQRRLAYLLRQDQAADLSNFIDTQPGPVITIEIKNAVEVAAQYSMIGGLIAKVAPDTIHRLVVKRTADMMRNQMTEHGVEVQVLVHFPGE